MSSSLGTDFAHALAAKDFGRAGELLDPEVDFRGLTPNREWRASSANGVAAEILPAWFEPTDHLDELLKVEEGDPVADRRQVTYRFRGHNDDGPFTVEQQAYFSERDGRITWMRVLCSGFRPEPA